MMVSSVTAEWRGRGIGLRVLPNGACGLVIFLLCATGVRQVIAAPPEFDQQREVSEDAKTQATADRFTVLDRVILAVAAGAITLFVSRRWYRLDSAPQRPAAFTPLGGIALVALMLILGQCGLVAAQRIFGFENPQTVKELALTGSIVYALQAIGVAAYIAMSASARARSAGGNLRSPRLRAAALAGAALLFAWPVVQAAAALSALLSPAPVELIAHQTLRLLMEHGFDPWALALVLQVLFAAPIVEEVLYRGIIQQLLVQAGLSRWPAIGFTSAIFALMHWGAVEPYALPALFVLSTALGWVYEKTGRLTAPIVMHILFNAANLALAIILTQ